MIPQFPEFKLLSLSDRCEIERMTEGFLPYSNFNFTLLYCWDFTNEAAISKLNNNLVVKHKGIVIGEMIVSFIGKRKIDDTIHTLLDYYSNQNIKLRVLPEEVISRIENNHITIIEARDYFDYLFHIDTFNYTGAKFYDKRKGCERFFASLPDAVTKQINPHHEVIQQQVIGVCEQWKQNKLISGKEACSEYEMIALQKLFSISQDPRFGALAIYDKDKLIAFEIHEALHGEYLLCHFMKADISYEGIYPFFFRQLSILVKSKGKSILHLEDDLGMKNLRMSKMSYKPIGFLKKYDINEG